MTFQVGHKVSEDVRKKISQALDHKFFGTCDYCGKQFHTRESHYKRSKRHFCCVKCYIDYRRFIMLPEEQNAYGHGNTLEERRKRIKARNDLNHHLRDKNIKRQPCEICGEPAEAHHDNYDEPLKVRWLCFKHHRQWHREHPELLKEREERNE